MWPSFTSNEWMKKEIPIFGEEVVSPKKRQWPARKVIVVAEELVSKKVIRKDPNRTLLPGFLVSAVVLEPWGAHPSPVQGYYGRDHEKYISYHHESRDRNGYLKWLEKWVLGVKDRREYLKLLGEERIRSLSGQAPPEISSGGLRVLRFYSMCLGPQTDSTQGNRLSIALNNCA